MIRKWGYRLKISTPQLLHSEKVLSRRFGKKFFRDVSGKSSFFSRRFGKKTSFQAESALLTTHIITDIFCSIDYTIYHIRVLNTCITKHAYSFESSLPLEACRASFLLAFYNWHRWKIETAHSQSGFKLSVCETPDPSVRSWIIIPLSLKCARSLHFSCV